MRRRYPAEVHAVRVSLPAHEAKLAEYEELRENAADVAEGIPEGPRISLRAGIEAERIWVEFWLRLRGEAESA
ncbi:MAG TPA: hypothetical protein VFG58_08685 [Solirubrobacterales bacterium]|nr:hypothetical protein [Solirubrobacterales bacterium]